jgi:hypothetical protein
MWNPASTTSAIHNPTSDIRNPYPFSLQPQLEK